MPLTIPPVFPKLNYFALWNNRNAAQDRRTPPFLLTGISSPMASGATKRDKVILAYSGGLDTSVMVPWIGEKYNLDVVTFTVDLGQGEDIERSAKRPCNTGAVDAVAIDARNLFVDCFVWPALMAGALYEGKYPLATALGRPLIAKLMVDAAREHGAKAVAHGCTGKGNDQVRFDVTFQTLAPRFEGHRSGARMEDEPRRGDRWLTPPSMTSPSRRPRKAPTASTRTSGAAAARPAFSKIPGTSRRPTPSPGRPTRQKRPMSRLMSKSNSSRASRPVSTARRWTACR